MMGRRDWRNAVLAALLGAGAVWHAGPVLAAPPPIALPVSEQDGSGGGGGFTSFLSGLKRSNLLLGNLFGLRSLLSGYGMTLVVQETSEYLGNTTGGTRKGFEYDGLTQAILQLDTQRAFGHYGGLFNVSALQIHGRNLSADNLSSLQTASGIEADRATRLWEFWYDQKFLEEDRLDVRIGQQSADQEFISSANALLFVNTMFGWPTVPSYDLPGGGPAYPLSAPAVRIRARPINPVTLLLGVFSGSPVNDADGDSQLQNHRGTSFPFHRGALVFTELQYAYPALGTMVYPGAAAPLSRVYKVGAWYDSERFDDQRFDAAGIPLASPASSAVAASHRGNFSLYAVADQMLWRNPKDPNNTLSGFTRIMGTPQSDRNPVSFSMNAGVVLHEPFRYRPDDTLGLGMGYAKVSSRVAAAERDAAALAVQTDPTGFYPIQGSETYVELTYQRQMRPWWQLQPDVQYVFNPSGGVADPNAPNRVIKNEFVIGIRTNVLF